MKYSLLSKYRDQLMGAAMLWVMLFHAYGLDLGPLTPIRAIGFGGVDIFLVLSGMGLVRSLCQREQSWPAFMARRARRVLPGYYAVMLPYTLLLMALGRATPATLLWNCTLLYYWLSPPGAFNWYITASMTFYAVTPFSVRRLKQSPRRPVWIGLGVVGGFALCRLLLFLDIWSYLDFFYRVPIFFLGLLIGFFLWEDRAVSKWDLLFWALSLAGGGAYLRFFLTDPDHFPLCHLFLFTTVPMCLVGCWCFEKLPLGAVRRFLRLAGENSLEIYLLNVSFFSESAPLQYWLELGLGQNLYYLAALLLNILLGVLLHRVVEGGINAVSRLRKEKIPAP